MKFIFKMFVLVGLIIVGKFLKEDNSAALVKDQVEINQEVYSLKAIDTLPFTYPAHLNAESVTKSVVSDKSFSFRLN